MHAKSELDITSLAPSSPRSPKRQHVLYYVQSPSRDSHDDENKSSSSIQPTPAFTTPSESPSHPHSRTSSATSRVSGNLRFKGFGNYNKRNECNVILEEDDDYQDYYVKNDHRSKPYKLQITVQTLEVFNFFTSLGSDSTGFPTKMVTVNCSLSMVVYNPASFFGIHVTSDPINLYLRKYYQPRKSCHAVTANLFGNKVPLCGAGAGASFQAAENGGVPVRLDFELRSRGDIVGRLVKTKHKRHVSCPLVIDSSNTKPIKSIAAQRQTVATMIQNSMSQVLNLTSTEQLEWHSLACRWHILSHKLSHQSSLVAKVPCFKGIKESTMKKEKFQQFDKRKISLKPLPDIVLGHLNSIAFFGNNPLNEDIFVGISHFLQNWWTLENYYVICTWLSEILPECQLGIGGGLLPEKVNLKESKNLVLIRATKRGLPPEKVNLSNSSVRVDFLAKRKPLPFFLFMPFSHIELEVY
ncbi:hypothetical protein RJ641_026069 [Dillenia turbinata]|uniref:Late embryogenesis abundant protein LEA-2 subgroup domain-containing protein n=1 Tax=Dillenia turbinata TaxID=194707 RepID=A0AAN8WFD0_9MAGN